MSKQSKQVKSHRQPRILLTQLEQVQGKPSRHLAVHLAVEGASQLGSSYHNASLNNGWRVGGGMGWVDLWGFSIWVKPERFFFFWLPVPHVEKKRIEGWVQNVLTTAGGMIS